MRRRVTEREAGPLIGKSPRTLERWRRKGIAPPHYVLPTGTVLYDVAELEKWLSRFRRDPQAEARA
jgi:hypothetical protein